jgi:AmmeMemoRadiSam system protein A
LAQALAEVIGARKDVLLVASTDLFHGYSIAETNRMDTATINFLKAMDAEGLYYGLRNGKASAKASACGGFGVVVALLTSKSLGHTKLNLLKHTNSAEATGNMQEGLWTVGYASCAIDNDNQEAGGMFTENQRKHLLAIARSTLETYLKNGKKPSLSESDPALQANLGAFVTLSRKGELRGCVGNMVGTQPLYLTIRDMAVEAARDHRFMLNPVEFPELKDIRIEISVLSPLTRESDPEKIQMGIHGVLVKRGSLSGVFLPQVATETGWTREEFLSELCSQKAGLPRDAWKDPATELYIFTAEIFSEIE